MKRRNAKNETSMYSFDKKPLGHYRQRMDKEFRSLLTHDTYLAAMPEVIAQLPSSSLSSTDWQFTREKNSEINIDH